MPSEMSTRCDSFSQVPSEQLIRRSSGHNDTCPPLNLEMMLSLEDKRKSMRRGSFLTNADVPRRSIIEHNKMIDYLRSQGFTLGKAVFASVSHHAGALSSPLINTLTVSVAQDSQEHSYKTRIPFRYAFG